MQAETRQVSTTFRAAVVSSNGVVSGIVGEDIVVIPNMSPHYASVAMNARGIIAGAGGQLAHLAVVCRELRKTMMVLPDACELIQVGMHVKMMPARLTIEVTSRDVAVDDV